MPSFRSHFGKLIGKIIHPGEIFRNPSKSEKTRRQLESGSSTSELGALSIGLLYSPFQYDLMYKLPTQILQHDQIQDNFHWTLWQCMTSTYITCMERNRDSKNTIFDKLIFFAISCD